ncbi:AI-2E family transporter [Winogradskyella ursingii]|uniref:AI-2E family transporter n=1 Tax=Winogradskyella ursingii TaxID=2686079 RepID=UPI0015C7A453|nr:AI-2E family transporter [Winogradskyella ursingii]
MISAKTIRQVFIILLILIIGYHIFKEMTPYFSGVLGAITLYVILQKIMSKLVKRGWRKSLAAGFLMLMSLLIITLPLAGIILLLGKRVTKAIENSEKVIRSLKSELAHMEQVIGYDLTSQIDTSRISSWLSDKSQAFAGSTFNGFIAITVMYFLLYYMLTSKKQLKKSLFEYIPIGESNLKTMANEIYEMVKANALGIPLVALAQGIVALIGFLIFSIPDPFFWAVIVTIGSMIPFVGNALGTIPVFILSISSGNTFQAWGILIYAIAVVGVTDNIIRLYVLQKLDNVHPLITLIGVLIGIPLFGFMGLIFGPLLVSLFFVIIKIYKQEYATEKRNIL